MDGMDLKVERVRLGLRQYRVAQALGVPATTIWQIESGRRHIPREQAIAIANTMRRLASRAQSQSSDDRVA